MSKQDRAPTPTPNADLPADPPLSNPARDTAAIASDVDEKLDQLKTFREVDAGGEFITTNQGTQLADNHNSLKAGERGPTLLEDFILREKITHFDHERIPERVVHARGEGAHGYFEVTDSLASITNADFLRQVGERTPVFVRFSTVVGSRGSADTVRDVRGFAVKFYTREGNFDLVGNNIPVFFIQDAMKFPDLVHAIKPEPHNEIPQAASAHDTFWDFASLMPESMHMLMWLMSDRAIPRSHRMMEGFGVHTFRFISKDGKSTFVKFHWKPLLGIHALAWDEAQKIAGKDPDFHRRDLWEAIDGGDFPQWDLGVQLFTEAEAANFDFDVLDATKLIPEELVPVRRVGRLILNRNPDNFFATTEQVAFHPGNLVPGIDFSNDPLLQGRLFSYTDTQLLRLGGPNFHELPINRSVCPVHNFQRDGLHRSTITMGRVAYEPNSLDSGSPVRVNGNGDRGFKSFGGPSAPQTLAQAIDAAKLRVRPESFADHYSQARMFWNSQCAVEKEHIASAFEFELSKVDAVEVRKRMVSHLGQIDVTLADRVANFLGLELDAIGGVQDASPGPALRPRRPACAPAFTAAGLGGNVADGKQWSAALSMMLRQENGLRKPLVETRKVAILATDGVNEDQLDTMKAALEAAGAKAKVVSDRLGVLLAAGDSSVGVDYTLRNMPSVMFDAVYVPGGVRSVDALILNEEAVQFIAEAYRHAKTISATAEGVRLLEAAGLQIDSHDSSRRLDTGVVFDSRKETRQLANDFIAALAKHRHWCRIPPDLAQPELEL